MQAKPGRQTPVNAGAYDNYMYNVMMKNIKKIQKIQKENNNNKQTVRYYIITNYCLQTAKSISKHNSVALHTCRS